MDTLVYMGQSLAVCVVVVAIVVGLLVLISNLSEGVLCISFVILGILGILVALFVQQPGVELIGGFGAILLVFGLFGSTS